jgi:hypothetical protein
LKQAPSARSARISAETSAEIVFPVRLVESQVPFSLATTPGGTATLIGDPPGHVTVKGEIANITGGERKIPSLRFGLSDNFGNEVYHWSLDSGTRPLRAGEITSFVTRVASPPETTKDIEIRFAHADEIGSNAGHE